MSKMRNHRNDNHSYRCELYESQWLRVNCNYIHGTIVSYTYSGDGLKRSEIKDEEKVVITTLVWDGSEYLGEQS
jgi:hypothetical protein